MIKIYRISYRLLLLFTFVSLTGSLYGINFKLPLAIISALSLFLILLRKNTPINYTNLLLFVSFISLATLAAFMGIFNGFRTDFVIDELIGVLSPLIILGLYNRNFISISSIKKSMLIGATIYSFTKVTIALLISINVISFADFYNFVQEAFGYQVVSMLISPEYKLVRIYLVNDLLISIVPLLLFNKENPRLSKPIVFFIYILFCLNMFLSYSRYLIAVFIVVSLLPLAKFRITAKKIIFAFYSICFCIIYLLAFGMPKIIIERFSSNNYHNIQSDIVRVEQFSTIVEMINKYKFFGAGLGSSDPARTNYVYELQWLSLVFKFGIPMFVILCLIILIYFIKNFEISFKSATLFCIILSSGLFNPYLESTVMGVCLLILYCNYGKQKDYFPISSSKRLHLYI